MLVNLSGFEDLRKQVTESQRGILDFVWDRFITTGSWPLCSEVCASFESPRQVREWINTLGKGVISETSGGSNKFYSITLAGILLTTNWREVHKLLSSFLGLLRESIRAHKGGKFLLSEDEIKTALALNEADFTTLLRSSEASWHRWGAFQGGAPLWGYEPWEKAIDLLDIPADQLGEHILLEALSIVRDADRRARELEALLYPTASEEPDSQSNSAQTAIEGEYKYDVALSFAGEDRQYVDKVASCLKGIGVRYFYDFDEEIELWGKELTEHFDYVFRKASRFCVMFISRAYSKKEWTRHERRSALARAVVERAEYILPARFDDTELDGLRPTVKYINLKDRSPEQFADMIRAKLRRAGVLLDTTPASESSQEADDLESLSELTAILMSLSLYSSEIELRDLNPGLNKLRLVFESAISVLRHRASKLEVSPLKISDDLEALSRICEEIAVYQFSMGSVCWREFVELVNRAQILAERTLIVAAGRLATVEGDFSSQVLVALNTELTNLQRTAERVSSIDVDVLHERIETYQAEVSSIGEKLFRIGRLAELSGMQELGEMVIAEASTLHLIETLSLTSDPWAIEERLMGLGKQIGALETARDKLGAK